MSNTPVRKSKFPGGSAALIFLARFFPSLASLVVILLFSRKLGQHDYGQYTRFWIHLNILCPVACLGVHVWLATYRPEILRQIAKKLGSRSLLLFVLWVCLVGVVFTLMQDAFDGIARLVPYLFFLLFSVVTIIESLVVVQRKYMVLAGINFCYMLLFVFVHLQFSWHSGSQVGLFTAVLGLLALRALALFIVFIKGNGVAGMAVQTDGLSTSWREMRSLWMHLAIYDVSQNVFTWVDKFLISVFLSLETTAVYYNGSVNIPFLPLLINAFGTAILISLAQTGQDSDKEHAVSLMQMSGRVLSSIVFPLFCFLFCFRHEFVVQMFTEKYAMATPIFAMSLLVLPLRAYSFTTLLQRYHQGRVLNIGGIADLLISCGLMYPLYRLMGLPGVALSFVLSTYLQAGYYLFHTARVIGTSITSLVPLTNWLLKLTMSGVLFWALHLFIVRLHMSMAVALVAGGSAYLLIAALMVVWEGRKKTIGWH